MAAIAITYALLAGMLELCVAQPGGVALAIMLLLLGQRGGPSQTTLAGSTTDPHPFQGNLLTFALFEAVFVCICADIFIRRFG